jgi:hypothetical protein
MKTQFITLCIVVLTITLQAQSNCYDYQSVSYTPPDGQMLATSQIPYLGGNATLTAWTLFCL